VQLLKYIPLQLTCCLILGIFTGFYWNLSPKVVITSLLFVFAILALCYYLSKKVLNASVYFMTSTFFAFFCIGIASSTFHNDLNKEQHYINYVSEENPVRTIIKISSTLKANDFYTKYEAYVLTINDFSSKGKILVNIKKDSLHEQLKIDDKLVVTTKFLAINTPKNPYQFNYNNYLNRHNIYGQITVSMGEVFMLKKSNTSLKGLADAFRIHVNNKLVENKFKDDELGIINALLFGQRQEISKELIENYSKAGAIHILAVSGLHVGIIMLMVSFLLKPLKRFKNGAIIRLIIIILFLWTFAFIAGMSASVVRAVTMFTALSIGLAIDRKNSVYKNLIISLFFLLLFNPYYLFEVGFQLSYLAVFSIVWLQPMLYKFWKPTYKIIDYFWQLFTVSLAAQIGVLPLSIYYFHQFPGLFFVSNLVIIPVLGFILGFGILVIFLSLCGFLPTSIAALYRDIISTMNTIISWIAEQESFLFQEIYFSIVLVFTSYLFIVFCFRWIQKHTISRLVYALWSFILLQGVFIYEKHLATVTNELVIFNKSRVSAFAIKKDKKISVYKSANFKENNTILKSYKAGNYNSEVEIIDTVNNIYQINTKKLLILDSLGVYNVHSLQPDYVLLSHSPKINLERLIVELNPKIIIADASNYKSYVERWQQTCLNSNIKFHYTTVNGSYIEKW
jgi:competence protein ComEC